MNGACDFGAWFRPWTAHREALSGFEALPLTTQDMHLLCVLVLKSVRDELTGLTIKPPPKSASGYCAESPDTKQSHHIFAHGFCIGREDAGALKDGALPCVAKQASLALARDIQRHGIAQSILPQSSHDTSVTAIDPSSGVVLSLYVDGECRLPANLWIEMWCR